MCSCFTKWNRQNRLSVYEVWGHVSGRKRVNTPRITLKYFEDMMFWRVVSFLVQKQVVCQSISSALHCCSACTRWQLVFFKACQFCEYFLLRYVAKLINVIIWIPAQGWNSYHLYLSSFLRSRCGLKERSAAVACVAHTPLSQHGRRILSGNLVSRVISKLLVLVVLKDELRGWLWLLYSFYKRATTTGFVVIQYV